VVQLLEDVQGLLPGGASGGGVTDRAVGIAEVGEPFGLVVAVAGGCGPILLRSILDAGPAGVPAVRRGRTDQVC